MMETRVAIAKCEQYDAAKIKAILADHFVKLDIMPGFFEGKKVLIKPNLLARRAPEKAVTTHPAVVTAVIELLVQYGANVTIAESPAGVYTVGSLKEDYKASGFMEAAEKCGAVFNYDTSTAVIHNEKGAACKSFTVIKPICDADIIIDLCKLKTHSLTKMTCAVKNLFGVIPGTDKIEMHARFSQSTNFLHMLIDLCEAIMQDKPVISICDAILAMEGEGPGTGDPRKLNAVLTSRNPYALDLACCELIGFGNTVEMIELEKKRGLCPSSVKGLEIIGTPIKELKVNDFVEPESQSLSRLIKLIPSFMKPRPVINTAVCVGCGMCARSCPAETITVENKKAHIGRKNCIKCFCCQELCPYKAVKIKRSIIFKWI